MIDYSVEFDVKPPYRMEIRADGSVWVEGEGLSLSVDSVPEAEQLISRLLTEDPQQVLSDYLMGAEDDGREDGS